MQWSAEGWANFKPRVCFNDPSHVTWHFLPYFLILQYWRSFSCHLHWCISVIYHNSLLEWQKHQFSHAFVTVLSSLPLPADAKEENCPLFNSLPFISDYHSTVRLLGSNNEDLNKRDLWSKSKVVFFFFSRRKPTSLGTKKISKQFSCS